MLKPFPATLESGRIGRSLWEVALAALGSFRDTRTAGRRFAALAFICCLASAPVAAEPAAGQSLAAFEAAVVERFAARGDRMGFALEECRLEPPFAGQGATWLGRAFSARTDTDVILVAVENGRVVRWQEFALPELEGWLTHHLAACDGALLELSQDGHTQRYRWDGSGFTRLP